MLTLTPRTNTNLFGHDDAESGWLREAKSGRLAHGWIISGPKGIGKATLAYRFAKQLLSSDHRVATGAHPDLLVIEPEEEGKEIKVEQARQIAQFFSLTPAEGEWRVVIVDSVDALNTNAANAILKALEEPPPQAVLLLISHNPGSLLPTIRSRCAMLKLKPLASNDFERVMRQLHPDMDEPTLTALYELSNGSPGVAIEYEGQGALALYEQILDVLALPSPDPAKIHALADQVGTGQVHAQFRLFSQLALFLISRLAKMTAGIPVEYLFTLEEKSLNALAPLHPPAVWAAKWQQAYDQFALAQARHLDLKQVVIVFFHSLMGQEGFSLAA